MKTFKCRKNRCKGVTAAVCIKRQWAIGMVHARYPECAYGCDQGVKVAEFHSDLAPDRPRPGCAKSVTCAVCGEKFPPMTKGQTTCQRKCGHVQAQRTRENNRHEARV